MDIKVFLNVFMALLFGALSFLLFFKGIDKRKSKIFNIFVINMMLWALGLAMFYWVNSPNEELFWSKFLYMAGGLVPQSFLYYSLIFTNSEKVKLKHLALIFLPSVVLFYFYFFTPFMISEIIWVKGVKTFKYGNLHLLWELNFAVVFLISFLRFTKIFKNSKGLNKEHVKYILVGTLTGVCLASITNVIMPFLMRCDYVWLGPALTSTWLFCITYTLLKHRIIGLRLALTNTSIFICVYALVLGVPFYLYAIGIKFIALILAIVLATVGPFIFIYLQRRAEAKILQESRRIQDVLIKLSIGLSSVRELQKLIKLIINGLGKSLQLDFTGIYLLEPNNEYILRMSEPVLSENPILKSDHPLLRRLRDKKGPVLLDELKHQFDNEKHGNGVELKLIINFFQSLNGTLIIPAIKEDVVLGFVVLGKGKVIEIYTREFLDVLTVVGNQMALAIENAVFYEETGKDWIQRAHDSRQKTMGAMGTGVAHQIRNRFNAISSQGLSLQDLLSFVDSSKITPEEFESIKKEYSETIERIFKDIEQGVEICENIKNYAKNTEAKPQVVELGKTITGAMRLLNLARKNINFTLVEENIQGITLWTNLSMLQDMFLNMFDNSNDAIGSKKEDIENGKIEKNNDDFKIKIRANPNGKMCEVVVEDNGKGILPEHLEEDRGVNVMWFTTKGATKGTGMGVPFMREFVKHNGGSFKIESEYTKWTRITFTLPLATQEQIKNGG